ncbi:MAG: RNA polymerase sigma-70 factor [Odoribacter sp.]|nr:RNA polymerase sigma-70 factor [Odoribacter sp.]
MDKQKQDIFEALFKGTYNGLFFHAYSFVRDEEEARDIVNDVFERIWKYYHRLDTTISLKSLLYKMVKSKCIDHLRRQKAKERFDIFYYRVNGEENEDYSDYEESIQKIMTLIEKMPAQTAVVFRKCFIERKKYKEVGEELNITVNTVRTHISKALRILRGGLSREEMTFLFYLLQRN